MTASQQATAGGEAFYIVTVQYELKSAPTTTAGEKAGCRSKEEKKGCGGSDHGLDAVCITRMDTGRTMEWLHRDENADEEADDRPGQANGGTEAG